MTFENADSAVGMSESAERQPNDGVQRGRARQYGICTYALEYDRVSDGAEGVFDQALTNGLAAIVAHSWPGKETDRKGRILSADALLSVIEEHGVVAGDGVVRVLDDPNGPEFGPSWFDDEPRPNFTEVPVTTLHGATTATQAIRHARELREETGVVLTEEHLAALQHLDRHRALMVLQTEAIDRACPVGVQALCGGSI